MGGVVEDGGGVVGKGGSVDVEYQRWLPYHSAAERPEPPQEKDDAGRLHSQDLNAGSFQDLKEPGKLPYFHSSPQDKHLSD
ncbi:hypothetical protein INR49_015234 [Caranx melampygus]|nr:hypothetical protein INR49_015234 [Caranx melampygus]